MGQLVCGIHDVPIFGSYALQLKPQVLSWPEYTVKLRNIPPKPDYTGIFRGSYTADYTRIGQIQSIPEYGIVTIPV
jgi:hypothetical protein